MDWKSSPALLTKLAYSEQLVAALTLLLIRQRDSVGLIRFDDRLRSVVPPKSRTIQWKRILTALADPGSGLGSDAAGALTQAGKLIRRRGAVMLVSDLLIDPQEVEDTVRALRAQGHDVTILHIIDPAEKSFDLPAGESLFVDPEGGAQMAATPADVREAYQATVIEAMDEWRTRFAAAGAFYEPITSDQPFGLPLRRAFAARQRRS